MPNNHQPTAAGIAAFLGETAWTFRGASGRDYAFRILPRGGPFPAMAAVYVLGYLHPRGHLAGNAMEPVLAGHGDDLRRCMEDLPNWDCALRECCNCVCVLATDASPEQRRDAVRDILRAQPMPCGPDAEQAVMD